MISTVALLCAVAVATVGSLDTWTFNGLGYESPGLEYVSPALTQSNFIVKTGPLASFKLPKTNSSAAESGWVQKERPVGPIGLESLTMWCPSAAYVLCLLYDDTGYIAGLQIALDQDIVSKPAFDWETQGYTTWNTTLNGETKNYYTIQQYYISVETLAKDPAIRIADRDPSLLLQDGNVWVTGFNRKLYNISTTTSYITGADSIYNFQSCIPTLGYSFYYNMTTETECASNTILPWFPLLEDGKFIGVGFYFLGHHSVDNSAFKWTNFYSFIQPTLPHGPQCLYNLAEEFECLLLYIYYAKKRTSIGCNRYAFEY